MKLYIKEKVFTWGDKFTVLSASGEPRYFVEGEVFTWGKKLHVYDAYEREVAFIKQELFTWLPEYAVFTDGREIARVRKEFSFFRPRYTIDGLNWQVEGSFWEHEYRITKNGRPIVSIEKEWMTWGDCYELNIADPGDEIMALAVVLTIDCVAEQQSNN
ncbi:MAG: LURP-one-related family protein [Oscillospiraceae bacterium]|nr:LURP-one-related family protein [Oscillospiraceae bacterium]